MSRKKSLDLKRMLRNATAGRTSIPPRWPASMRWFRQASAGQPGLAAPISHRAAGRRKGAENLGDDFGRQNGRPAWTSRKAASGAKRNPSTVIHRKQAINRATSG